MKQSSASLLQEAQGPVFYLGLQKSGTSTFASFMDLIGIPSIHGLTPAKEEGLFGVGWRTCDRPVNGTEFPLHEAFAREMLPEPRAVFAAWLRNHSQFAAADKEWPLMFRFLDENTEGRAKFVIWRRDPAQWAESFCNFFDTGPSAPVNRLIYLSYGQFRKSDLGCEQLEQLPKAYESHINAVLEYFNDPSRRSRLLELDFTSSDAGHALCTFVLGKSPTCDEYTYLPEVPPEELWGLLSDESKALSHDLRHLNPTQTGNIICN